MVTITTMSLRPVFIAVLLILIRHISHSQDLHLTQYYTSIAALNPALTGSFEGDLKLTANYRSQWGAVDVPIKTTLFSLEKNMTKQGKGFGVGLVLMDDQTGLLQLHTSKALMSGSYRFTAAKNSFQLGLQAGMMNRKIFVEGQSYPSQWDYDTGDYETSIHNGEQGPQNSSMNAVANGGVNWSRYIGRVRFSTGYALFHFNRPKDKLVLSRNIIPFRHVVHAIGTANVVGWTIQPHVLYMYSSGATAFLVSTNFTKKFLKDSKILVGAGYRGSTINSDALYGVLGYGQSRIEVALSMDFNISLLSHEVKRKSVFEISISYTTPARDIKKMTIPCHRY